MAARARKRTSRRLRIWRVLVPVAALGIAIWWWAGTPSREQAPRIPGEQPALQNLQHRAERGDRPAQMELADKYCSGAGVKKNIFKCAEWYRKAANLGNGVAMLRLGDLYASGEGFILDKEAAAMWWRKAESTTDAGDEAKRMLLQAAKTPTADAPPRR